MSKHNLIIDSTVLHIVLTKSISKHHELVCNVKFKIKMFQKNIKFLRIFTMRPRFRDNDLIIIRLLQNIHLFIVVNLHIFREKSFNVLVHYSRDHWKISVIRLLSSTFDNWYSNRKDTYDKRTSVNNRAFSSRIRACTRLSMGEVGMINNNCFHALE